MSDSDSNRVHLKSSQKTYGANKIQLKCREKQREKKTLYEQTELSPNERELAPTKLCPNRFDKVENHTYRMHYKDIAIGINGVKFNIIKS